MAFGISPMRPLESLRSNQIFLRQRIEINWNFIAHHCFHKFSATVSLHGAPFGTEAGFLQSPNTHRVHKASLLSWKYIVFLSEMAFGISLTVPEESSPFI